MADHLAADVASRGNALTAGDVGYRYLLRALADGGRSDVIFDMNSRRDRPGYGWMLDRGATSLTEAWDARPSSSQNHFMLGHLLEWFYADLAGIAPEEDSVGFDRIRIRPGPVGDVRWAKANYESVRGPIAVEWKRSADTHDVETFELKLTVPVGSTATVYVPATVPEAVTESGRPAADAVGVKLLRVEKKSAVFAVQSGTYRFESY